VAHGDETIRLQGWILESSPMNLRKELENYFDRGTHLKNNKNKNKETKIIHQGR
jgi:hypothetical protein